MLDQLLMRSDSNWIIHFEKDPLWVIICPHNRYTAALVNINEGDWIFLSFRCGRLDVLKELLNHKANLEARDNGGMTALMWAAFNGKLDVVKELVANQACTQTNTFSHSFLSKYFLTSTLFTYLPIHEILT